METIDYLGSISALQYIGLTITYLVCLGLLISQRTILLVATIFIYIFAPIITTMAYSFVATIVVLMGVAITHEFFFTKPTSFSKAFKNLLGICAIAIGLLTPVGTYGYLQDDIKANDAKDQSEIEKWTTICKATNLEELKKTHKVDTFVEKCEKYIKDDESLTAKK